MTVVVWSVILIVAALLAGIPIVRHVRDNGHSGRQDVPGLEVGAEVRGAGTERDDDIATEPAVEQRRCDCLSRCGENGQNCPVCHRHGEDDTLEDTNPRGLCKTVRQARCLRRQEQEDGASVQPGERQQG